MAASSVRVSAASMILALLLVTSGWAHPQHLPAVYYQQQQQQQLLPGSFFYQAQIPGQGVAKVASVVHHSAGGPAGSDASHYVIVYPPAGVAFAQKPPVFRQQPVVLAGQGPNVVYREEEESVGEAPEEPPARPGWWATIINIFAPSNSNNQGVATTTPAPVIAEAEETTPAAAAATVASETASAAQDNKPEKVVDENTAAVEQNLPVDTDKKNGALETLDEPLPQPQEGGDDSHSEEGDTLTRVEGGGTRFMAVQQPQFYGNFANLDQLAAQGGPVATYLLGRSPEAPQAPQVPQFPIFPPPLYQYQPLPFPKHLPLAPGLVPVEDPAEAPGVAALEFQKTLQAAKLAVVPVNGGQRSAVIPGSKHVDISQNLEKFLAQAHQSQATKQQESLHGLVKANIDAVLPQLPDLQALQNAQNHPGLINVGPGYQSVYYLVPKQAPEEAHAVAVDAHKGNKDKPAEDDKIHPVEDQAGPSVAQAKPQAIALAGPGGTAAATPIATALVGPGGLAVSAPTATAVAGQTGGGALTGPAAAAVNKYLTLTGGTKGTSDELKQHGFLAYGTAI